MKSATYHRPGDSTPAPRLTREQRRKGYLRHPLTRRARRAGLTLEERDELVTLRFDGEAVLNAAPADKAEAFLTARGW